MSAPYVFGFPYVYGLPGKYACWNVNPPPPGLSTIAADYNNRRVFSGLRLAHRLPAAHLKEKRTAVEYFAAECRLR
jgi:hypothetical protein